MEELHIFDQESGTDEPSDKDYKFEEVYSDFGGSTTGKEVLNRRSSLQNQNAQKETYYACPIFWLIHAMNELNAMEDEKLGTKREELNWLEETRQVVTNKEPWFAPTRWGTMQWSLERYRKAWIINGYVLVRPRGNANGNRMTIALNKGFILYSGSNTIDWKTTSIWNSGICKLGNSYGHIFCIDGYSVVDWIKRFHIRQSVGTRFYDGGYAYLLESQLPVLFSCYAIRDNDDTNQLMSHKAKVLGIYDGEGDMERPTRFKAASMISKASGKPLGEIYNAERIGDDASDYELQMMMTNWFGTYETVTNTRDLAAFCVRSID